MSHSEDKSVPVDSEQNIDDTNYDELEPECSTNLERTWNSRFGHELPIKSIRSNICDGLLRHTIC